LLDSIQGGLAIAAKPASLLQGPSGSS